MKKIGFIIFLILFGFAKSQNQQLLDKTKIAELKTYLKGKNYNQELAIFIDFKKPSDHYRFFIFNLKKEKIIEKGIVSHGSGSQNGDSNHLTFSNIENSYQSSLGKYEIKQSYFGSFGKSYRLKGLDDTNSNAMKRAIVLHAYSCIKDHENVEPACLSLGCPMLSTSFFKTTATYIDQSKRTIILYAFY